MENTNNGLLKRLIKVNLLEAGNRVPAAATDPASIMAHARNKAIWWYNVLSQKLEYSETAATHQDRKAFSDGPYDGSKGWIRGRVFKHTDRKYYIVVYVGSSVVDSALGSAVNLVAKNLPNLYSQIRDNFRFPISYVVDEYWNNLTDLAESKKNCIKRRNDAVSNR
jgi:hypothetical protein